MSIIARDLPYGAEPFQTQPPEYEWPFLVNGDSTSFIVTRTYKQRIEDYNADRLAGRYLPGIYQDPAHPGAYLMTESKAGRTPSGMATFTRTFARVPTQQVSYSSIVVNKPAFPTADFNSAWSDSTSATATANIWSAALAATVSRYASGGTFTITYVQLVPGLTSTTAALNWNDSTATIKAALEALASSIADGNTYTVTGSVATGFLAITYITGVNWTGAQFSINVASLTPAINATTAGIANQYAAFYLARSNLNFNRTAHGLVAGQAIRILIATTGGGTAATDATVVDADNFTIASSSNQPTLYTYYRTLLRTYTPGIDRVVARITEDFYLPRVTPGIVTPKDIPTPDVAINDTQLLTLITNSATGFQTYDADPLERWPDSSNPIYRQELTAINLDNL